MASADGQTWTFRATIDDISAADAWFEGREFEADDIAAVVLSLRDKPDA
jgi:hypothetical protein